MAARLIWVVGVFEVSGGLAHCPATDARWFTLRSAALAHLQTVAGDGNCTLVRLRLPHTFGVADIDHYISQHPEFFFPTPFAFVEDEDT